jgi:predicted nucleotidyltransferase
MKDVSGGTVYVYARYKWEGAECMVTAHMTDIVHEFKQTVSAKYTVSDIRLFGSNARGDASEASDIDIYLQIANLTKDIEQDVYNCFWY